MSASVACQALGRALITLGFGNQFILIQTILDD
jgi:hypothetical protein